MIKNNELMIGDWVHSNIHNINTTVSEIEGGGVWLKNLKCWERHFEHELDPVPITPEILEKNGFVIKKKWAQKGNFGDNPLIMWHYDDDIITRDFKHELEIHQNDTGKVHIRVQCNYVHELQHAMKLCGIKFEIEI